MRAKNPFENKLIHNHLIRLSYLLLLGFVTFFTELLHFLMD